MNAPSRKRKALAADAPRQLDLFGDFVPNATLRDLGLRIEDPFDFLGAFDCLQDLTWVGDAATLRALLDQAVTAAAMGLCRYPAPSSGLWFWPESGARWAYPTAAERVERCVQAFGAMVPSVEASLLATLTACVFSWLDAETDPFDGHAALTLLDALPARWARILDAETVEPRFAAVRDPDLR